MTSEYAIPKIPVILPEQYAQAGEDLIVLSLISRLNYLNSKDHKNSFNFSTTRYLEIGANHPFAASSTFLLYTNGAKGLLVEPNHNMCELLREHRPSDIVIEAAAVSGENGTYDFYVSEANELSSLVELSPLRWHETYSITDKVKVRGINIKDLVYDFWNSLGITGPTYLSIDCEGLDFELIREIDFGQFPFDIIQIEPGEPLTKGNLKRIEKALSIYDYALVAITEVNSIFINKTKFSN